MTNAKAAAQALLPGLNGPAALWHNYHGDGALNMDEKVIDRIRGTILGAACGSALGGSAIGLTRKDIIASVGLAGLRDFSPGLSRSFLPDHQPGTILADIFMALELAESVIVHKGALDIDDLRGRYRALLESEEFLSRAPGAPCLAGLRRVADGLEPVADGSAESTHDHGAARSFPLGCLPDRIDHVDLAVRQAKVSQGDSRVWAAAAVLADSIHGFVRGERMDSEEGVRAYVRKEFDLASGIDPRFAESWDDVAPDLDYKHPAHELPYSLINVDSHVNEAVPTAVGIFLIFRHSLEAAVCAAAVSGGDTDTTGTIVGALSGAYHGASAIPSRWLDRLEHKDRLEAALNGLISLW